MDGMDGMNEWMNDRMIECKFTTFPDTQSANPYTFTICRYCRYFRNWCTACCVWGRASFENGIHKLWWLHSGHFSCTDAGATTHSLRRAWRLNVSSHRRTKESPLGCSKAVEWVRYMHRRRRLSAARLWLAKAVTCYARLAEALSYPNSLPTNRLKGIKLYLTKIKCVVTFQTKTEHISHESQHCLPLLCPIIFVSKLWKLN